MMNIKKGYFLSKRPNKGFTLLEVLLTLVIISITCLYIFQRRSGIIQEAEILRDYKIAWMLAAQKLSEIELDRKLFKQEGSEDSGSFEGFEGFSYTYKIQRKEIKIGKEEDPKTKPRFYYEIELTVSYPSAGSKEDYIKLFAHLPEEKEQPKKPKDEKDERDKGIYPR